MNEEELKNFYNEELETPEQRQLREENHAKELELFKRNYTLVMRQSKKVLGIVFGVIACVFTILGMVFLIVKQNTLNTLGTIYLLLGVIWLVFCVIGICLPVGKIKDVEKAYKRYKNSIYATIPVYPIVVNPYQQKVEVDNLKQKIEELEEKVKKLESKK